MTSKKTMNLHPLSKRLAAGQGNPPRQVLESGVFTMKRNLFGVWMFPLFRFLFCTALIACLQPVLAHEHGKMDAMPVAYSACAQALVQCARSATPVFGPEGKVWLLWSHEDRLRLSTSLDGGNSFASTVVISEKMPILDDNSEARPKLVLLADGSLLVAVTQRDSHYVGRLLTARSVDGGKTFTPFKPMLGGVGQRFETPLLLPSGRLVMAWLDWRNQAAAKAKGQAYKDSGIAVAWSDDNGQTFQGTSILADYSCDCCRIAAAVDRDGLAVFAWRHVFEGTTRDHAAAKLKDDGSFGPLRRIAVDDWKLDACPRHGPSLTIGPDGSWHATWFTGAAGKSALQYARSTDQGVTFSTPEAIGKPAKSPARPQVLAGVGSNVWRAWKEFDGQVSTVIVQRSADNGLSWEPTFEAARTGGASDHPLLVSSGDSVYLSWLTRDEGYRLKSLNKP